jgi:hypothetical protein
LFAAPLATVALFVPASGRAGRAEGLSKRAARFGAALLYGDAWAALGPALLDGSISLCDEVDVARSNRS